MITAKQAILLCTVLRNLSNAHDDLRRENNPLHRNAQNVMIDGEQLIAKINEDIDVLPWEVDAWIENAKLIMDLSYPPNDTEIVEA
jgi:hypothetical protein